MPFPDVDRVIYNKNPLDQVICQLRFPPILKIDTEIPAKFQDSIRNDFPNFYETSELKIEGPPALSSQIPSQIIRHMQRMSGNKNYEFVSENGQWKINLTHTFIALTCNKYIRWEEFIQKLEDPLNYFIEVYSPSYFSRIGLRYVDVIRRSELGLNDCNWSDLLQPYILGILSSSNVGGEVQDFVSKYEILLSDKESSVRIITRFVEYKKNGEMCFMIDSDFFNNKKTEINYALEKLNFFNKRATRLIQWCITKKLHKAMEPKKI